MRVGALGIDFGTSTTSAAFSTLEGTNLIGGRQGPVFPSVVAFMPNGERLVGFQAKMRKRIDGPNTLHSVKRILGHASDSPVVQRFMEHYPFKFLNQGVVPVFETRAGVFSAMDIATFIIQEVTKQVEEQELSPEKVVVAIPVEFDEQQRNAVAQAVKGAGLPAPVFVDEPLAVARAYSERIQLGKRFVIYDIGGGTVDIAVCEKTDRGFRVLASGGDPYLGGDDIDALLAKWIQQQVLKNYSWDLASDPGSFARLLTQAELTKIRLSTQNEWTIELSSLERNDTLKGRGITIDRYLVQGITVDFVRRSFVLCDEVIRKAGLDARKDIDQILIAGGTTRGHYFAPAVEHYFQKTPISVDSPDTLVALGAAWVGSDLLWRKTSLSQRRSQRVRARCEIEVSVKDGRQLSALVAENISQGGMFIAMDDPLPEGSMLSISLTHQSNSVVTMKAKVAHRLMREPNDPNTKISGVGVSFEFMSHAEKEVLTGLLERLKNRFGTINEHESHELVIGRVVTEKVELGEDSR